MNMNCADCPEQYCQSRRRENLPEGCPMLEEERIERGAAEYQKSENKDFYKDSLDSMRQSFGKMPRIIEAVNFCGLRGYHKIGVAYCSGMLRFGKIVSDVFRKNGFEVCSAGCKLGGFSPEELIGCVSSPAYNNEKKPVRAICNPIGQAMYLNEMGTEFNVVAGLCVGHDSLFFKYSQAPCTMVVLKDRLFSEQCLRSAQAAENWEF